MTNPDGKKAYQEIPVTINGQSLTLAYPYSALAMFCDEIGVGANALQERLSPDNIKLSDLPILLWAGLWKVHRFPLIVVQNMIDDTPPHKIKDIFTEAQGALSAAFASDERVKADEEEAGNVKPGETPVT